MPTESAQEQPSVDATNRAACGSSPRWRRTALSLAAACQSTTAARNSLVAIMIIAVATTVTWTAPTGGRPEAPEGAPRALKWTPRATPIESQNSEHAMTCALAVRSQWDRPRRLVQIFVLSESAPPVSLGGVGGWVKGGYPGCTAITLISVRGNKGRVLGLPDYVRGNKGRVLQGGEGHPPHTSKRVRGSAKGGEGWAKMRSKPPIFSFLPRFGSQTFTTGNFRTIFGKSRSHSSFLQVRSQGRDVFSGDEGGCSAKSCPW